MRRGKKRVVSERRRLYELLDEATLCHWAMSIDDAPRVLPTVFARVGETMYLHGSTGARGLREAGTGTDVCVAVTLLDGIVYARAAFHNSVNYRSAVIHGRARDVDDESEKETALRAITEHVAPGSWDYSRRPTSKENAATAVVAVPLHEASVKVRDAPPGDDTEDIASGMRWAGVLPLHNHWGEPRRCPDASADIEVPEHVRARVSGAR